MRNTPKLHLARVVAGVRAAVLQTQRMLLANGRIDAEGDIWHLTLQELDECLNDPSRDMRSILKPHKEMYTRAKQATQCPMLIDSRCRILKPNVVQGEPGTLVGTAISPGVAQGYVRVVTSPTEPFVTGEVLVTIVTDPAWTPLFVGAAAVVLQTGGALQHGALCAREYGKPAVSGIDVVNDLKSGMLVQVDGNTGIVKILEDLDAVQKRPSRQLSRDDLDESAPLLR